MGLVVKEMDPIDVLCLDDARSIKSLLCNEKISLSSLELIEEQLKCLVVAEFDGRFAGDRRLRVLLQFAFCLTYTVEACANQMLWDKAAECEEIFSWLVIRNPDCDYINWQQAIADCCLVACYARCAKWEKMNEAEQRLISAADRFPSHSEIQFNFAQGMCIAYIFGKDKTFIEKKDVENRLLDVAARFPMHSNIQLELVLGCVGMIVHYGRQKNMQELERVERVLIETALPFSGDHEFDRELKIGLLFASNLKAAATSENCHKDFDTLMKQNGL